MADNKTPRELANRRVQEQRAENYFNMFRLNEGNKPKVYEDSKGNRTIGIGFNLEDAGNKRFLKEQGIDINELFRGRELTDKETKVLYNHSLRQAFADAQKFDPDLAKRPEAARMAIVELALTDYMLLNKKDVTVRDAKELTRAWQRILTG